MFDLNSRARLFTLGAVVCAAATMLSACAHTQQTPPSDSASPRSQGGGGWGRGGGGSHMRRGGGPHGDPMLEGLNLTKDQRSQVTLIHDRYRLKADSLRMGNVAHDSTGRAQFRTMMTQEMGEIRAVLTPDQQKQFDDKMAQMKERHQQRDGHGGPNGQDGPPPPPPAPPAQ